MARSRKKPGKARVKAWLNRHPRFTFHFTPTSCSWANAVEGFFAKLTRRRLKRGVFKSIGDLQAAINRFIAETNGMPKPFVWTKSADDILSAVKRGKQTLESIHWRIRAVPEDAAVLCERKPATGLCDRSRLR